MDGPPRCIPSRGRGGDRLGRDRSSFQLQRYLAIGDQYWHHHRYLPDGVSDPKHAKRDTLAIQLKLSELVLAMKGAENKFAAIEDLSDEELEELHKDCRTRAEMTLQQLESRKTPKRNGVRKPRAPAPGTKTPARVPS